MGKPLNTSHESLLVSPYIQQELEALCIKVSGEAQMGPAPPKVFKFIFNLKS